MVSNGDTQMLVYFNEAVDEASAGTISNYTVSNLSTATLTVTAKDAENLLNTPYDFNRSDPFAAGDEKIIAYSIVSAINADTQSPVRAYAYGGTIELVSRTFGPNGDLSIASGLSNVSATVPVVSNNNVVIISTELQSAFTYTLTVNGVADMSNNFSSGQSASFTGMASVNVGNGPVGNSVNGIGNVNNLSIISAIEYNGKLYVSTMNKAKNEFQTEIYASDSSGVYFTHVNYSGFNPPNNYTKQQQTTSFTVFEGLLWASTSETPSEKLNVYCTDGTGTPHTWTLDTPTEDLGNNGYTMLLNYGIGSPRLYVFHAGNLSYRVNFDDYKLVASSADFGVSSGSEFMKMVAFGGRLYVGVPTPSGMRVFRSKGANANAPEDFSDFEKVLDADDAAPLGMNGYDGDNPVDLGDVVPVDASELHYADVYNSAVTSITVYNGFIYIGARNDHGAQVWRGQDGLTWERVLDFGVGIGFGGKNDPNNIKISALQVNGSFIYAGTKNSVTVAGVWRSPDGAAWEQFGTDGFGASSYTDIPAMAVFKGLIDFCMEDLISGGAIFRANN